MFNPSILKLSTINVDGLRAPKKRAHTFNYFLNEGLDIIALQETHCTNADLENWKKEWPGLSVWNTYSNRAAGVAILFNPKLKIEIIDTEMDFNGRVIQLTVIMDGNKFQIVNVYTPNPDTQIESEGFIGDLRSYLNPSLPILMCGDFNMVENINLDRHGGKPRALHTFGLDALKDLKQEFSLTDFWRENNPNKKEYTWHCRYDKIFSRLDRIYMPSAWSTHIHTSSTFRLV